MNLLALDVGTSSVKAAVLEQATGQPLAEPAIAKYALSQPETEAAVIDPETLWRAVLEAGRSAAAGRQVEGIGMDVFSPGWLLLDEKREPLTPIVTHLDRRARPLARRLRKWEGDRFLLENGNPVVPGGISGVVSGNIVGGPNQFCNLVTSPVTNLLVENNQFYGSGLWADFAGEPGQLGHGSVKVGVNKIDRNGQNMPPPPAWVNQGVIPGQDGNATQGDTVTKPASPSELRSGNVTATSVTLNWKDLSNNESGFRIEQSTDGVNYTQSVTTAANVRDEM
jgi:hypothetical protein